MSAELQVLKARMTACSLVGPQAEAAHMWKWLEKLLGGGCSACENGCQTCSTSCSGGGSNGAAEQMFDTIV